MRINRFVALTTGMSRRNADTAIATGRVKINGLSATAGQIVVTTDKVCFDDHQLISSRKRATVMLNKPIDVVCSRRGQGSRTIYDLLPAALYHLKPVGRLDKDSSGLLLLTDDGELAHQLTHPKFQKNKLYEVTLNKPLTLQDKRKIEAGVNINNEYVSRLRLAEDKNHRLRIQNCSWQVTMSQGHNRQIRRTFEALGYKVDRLHRTGFGTYRLTDLVSGHWINVKKMI